ncbi:hypothetical protein [Arenimonas aestuarii]
MASNLQGPFKPLLAVVAALTGLALARREALRPVLRLDWQGPTLVVHDTRGGKQVLQRPTLCERGPLLCIQARTAGGRLWSRSWWPDTLSAPDRRRLRLAGSVSPRSGIHLPSMAA